VSEYRVALRPAAARSLRKLDPQVRRRVQGAIALLARDLRPPAARAVRPARPSCPGRRLPNHLHGRRRRALGRRGEAWASTRRLRAAPTCTSRRAILSSAGVFIPSAVRASTVVTLGLLGPLPHRRLAKLKISGKRPPLFRVTCRDRAGPAEADAVIEACFAELEPLVEAAGACRGSGKARAHPLPALPAAQAPGTPGRGPRPPAR